MLICALQVGIAASASVADKGEDIQHVTAGETQSPPQFIAQPPVGDEGHDGIKPSHHIRFAAIGADVLRARQPFAQEAEQVGVAPTDFAGDLDLGRSQSCKTPNMSRA